MTSRDRDKLTRYQIETLEIECTIKEIRVNSIKKVSSICRKSEVYPMREAMEELLFLLLR